MGKVVVGFSGGLDTTVALHWLKHYKNMKVVALTVNLGQGRDFDLIGERALAAGADHFMVFDARRQFIRNYCWKVLSAGARYEGAYMLSAALSRPLIAIEMVRLAHDMGVPAVAHAAPPQSNDQFRLECSFAALDPTLRIVAPYREWRMNTRDELLQYARRYRLKVDRTQNDAYTRDVNIWGTRCSGGPLEAIDKAPPPEAFSWTREPHAAPDEHADASVGFEKGEPVSLNGEKLEPIELMERLNKLGSRHGIGRLDTVENRLMGFKNREIYEAPAATVLHAAHDALERLVLDKATLSLKRQLGESYAETVYNGLWFSTLRESLDAFMKNASEYVTGEATVRLYKGSATIIGAASAYSTYDREQALLRQTGGSLPEGAAAGMLTIARLHQLNRAFKQRPRL